MKPLHCEQLKETLWHHTHQSGLEIYVLPKGGYSKSYAIFATKYGSADADFVNPHTGQRIEVPDGVAHFLEHKMFEQPDGTDAFAVFSQTGADANAFTSFLTTAYLFSCTNGFYENLKHLLSFVQTPHFTEENVAKEQGIIGQEIRMYEDDPGWRSYFNVIEAMYHENPVRRDIAGTVDSIAKITPALLYDCYNTFYHPSNMILFCTGDTDPDKVAKLVEESLSPDLKDPGEIQRLRPCEPDSVFQKEKVQAMSVSQPLFYLGIKSRPKTESFAQELLYSVLLEAVLGKSSSLYQELYSQGLITPSFGTEVTCEQEYAHLIMGGSAPDPRKTAQALKEGLQKQKEAGLREADFVRAKKVVLGDIIRLFNSVEQISTNFINTLFRGATLFDAPAILARMTIEDCNKAMEQLFCEERYVLSIVTPKGVE